MVFVQGPSSQDEEDVESMEFGGGIKMKKTTKKVQICSKVKINDFWVYWSRSSHQDSMTIRSEHSRRNGDDWIITNSERQGELNELKKASYKESHEELQVDLLLVYTSNCDSMSREKQRKVDKDDQWTRLIGRWIVQS